MVLRWVRKLLLLGELTRVQHKLNLFLKLSMALLLLSFILIFLKLFTKFSKGIEYVDISVERFTSSGEASKVYKTQVPLYILFSFY